MEVHDSGSFVFFCFQATREGSVILRGYCRVVRPKNLLGTAPFPPPDPSFSTSADTRDSG